MTAVLEQVGDLPGSDELRALVTDVRDRLGATPAVVGLAATVGARPVVIVATNAAARDGGAKAARSRSGPRRSSVAAEAAATTSRRAAAATPLRSATRSPRSRRDWPLTLRGHQGIGMRTGVRLGVDVGKVRVGVARSDRDGVLATPVETVQRRGSDLEPVLARIAAIAAELEAIELVVGLPIAMSGRDTPSTADARAVAGRLAEGGVPVRLVDERLTTVSAQSALHASGGTRGVEVRDRPGGRGELLQHALDAERARGEAPGALVDPEQE